MSKSWAIRHDWLPLDKAAGFLSDELKEEITEADILQLAWDRRLILSVMLPPKMAVTTTKVTVNGESEPRTAVAVQKIGGVWDIPVYGTFRRQISRRYYELTGIELVPTIGWRAYETPSAVLVSDDGNTLATLTTSNKHVSLLTTATKEEIRAAMEDALLNELHELQEGVPLVARTEVLEKFVATVRQNHDSDWLGEKEKKSLLALVYGMAIKKYDYKPGVQRNKATGENAGSIYADLESLGLTLNADTIRKFIKEAEAEFGTLPETS